MISCCWLQANVKCIFWIKRSHDVYHTKKPPKKNIDDTQTWVKVWMFVYKVRHGHLPKHRPKFECLYTKWKEYGQLPKHGKKFECLYTKWKKMGSYLNMDRSLNVCIQSWWWAVTQTCTEVLMLVYKHKSLSDCW